MKARKQQEVGEAQVTCDVMSSHINECQNQNATLLSRSEVDELYDLLDIIVSALDDLQIKYVIIKGSLLGAVRSESILFNDDDIDIAIIDDGQGSYDRCQKNLPGILEEASRERSDITEVEVNYQYHRRSREGCDRVKSTEAPRVRVDIFVLRKYESRDDLIRQIDTDENLQDADSRFGLVDNLRVDNFPLYHYDNRKAIELFTNQYFSPSELFPLQRLKFGPLEVHAPRETIQSLQRCYGDDCFTHYAVAYPLGRPKPSDQINWETAEKFPLLDEHFQPIEHSGLRRWKENPRFFWGSKINGYDCEPELEPCSDCDQSPPLSSSLPIAGNIGLARSKSLFVLGANATRHPLPPPSLFSSLTTLHDLEYDHRESGPTKLFGADLRSCTTSSHDSPDFEKDLRKVMEPHLQAARRNREASRSLGSRKADASICSFVGVPYTSLRDERRFLFDDSTYPIHEVLAQTLGIKDLSKLHDSPIQDMERILAPLLSREGRRRFHACYDNLVTGFCIPLLHSMALEKGLFHMKSPHASSRISYRYQAFPCIRIVRPGDFSIGPHCDTIYGHSVGNLNFHIPLTPSYGTNALHTESHPGKEDWHPLSTKSVGLGYIFDGARCLHFTLENTTEATRVSLDFRIAIYNEEHSNSRVDGGLCSKSMLEDRFSLAGPGYYDEASVNIGFGGPFFPGSMVAQKNNRYLCDPDIRVGFPFMNKATS